MALPNQLAKRLKNELEELRTSAPPGVSASPVSDDNLLHWQATIEGPKDTPYEGGLFKLVIHIPMTYPMSPPIVRFVTPVYHMNTGFGGTICLDILRDNDWSPALTIASLLLSIQSLLMDLNPNSVLDGAKARLWKTNRTRHDQQAKAFTKRHAKK